jgi:hypothetical protein
VAEGTAVFAGVDDTVGTCVKVGVADGETLGVRAGVPVSVGVGVADASITGVRVEVGVVLGVPRSAVAVGVGVRVSVGSGVFVGALISVGVCVGLRASSGWSSARPTLLELSAATVSTSRTINPARSPVMTTAWAAR